MKKPFIGASLPAGQTISIPSGVQRGLAQIASHLAMLQEGILPDQRLEEMGLALKSDWENLHSEFLTMGPCPEKEAIDTILEAVLDISAPHTISGQPVSLRAVLHETVHDTPLATWAGDVNHLANQPGGLAELQYVITAINKLFS